MRNIRNSNRQTGRPEIYEICLITVFMTGAPDLLREYGLRRNCENASIGGQSIYACSSWSDWLFVCRSNPFHRFNAERDVLLHQRGENGGAPLCCARAAGARKGIFPRVLFTNSLRSPRTEVRGLKGHSSTESASAMRRRPHPRAAVRHEF
jgi:hypothetical protein